MKLTPKVLEFRDAVTREMEKAVEIIAKEYAELKGIKYNYPEYDDLDGDGGSVKLMRASCGRGCCPSEVLDSFSVEQKDLIYPSLKINELRTKIKQ